MMAKMTVKQIILTGIIVVFTVSSALAAGVKNSIHVRHGKLVVWSYSGAEGPNYWAELSERYGLCKTGQMQSPVDIGDSQQSGLAPFTADYRATPLRVINNGHTIEAEYAPGSNLTQGSMKYELLQFHFHSPSENMLSGKQFDMEIHFVHKDQAGHLGVLAVFVEKGAANPAIGEIWRYLPQQANSATEPEGVTFNGGDLLPTSRRYYRFVGSLTTPPCSEGVQWHVLKQPITASPEQIDAFLRVIGPNNRPVQKVNNRLVIDSKK
jgi:carbonic anhydrase